MQGSHNDTSTLKQKHIYDSGGELMMIVLSSYHGTLYQSYTSAQQVLPYHASTEQVGGAVGVPNIDIQN